MNTHAAGKRASGSRKGHERGTQDRRHGPVVPSLAAKVAFLQHADSYPDPTREVDAIETHMSWVFLTDHYAYKLKKPYSRDLIDYGTPAARHLSCEREVRLNQRLAPEVYLDVVALKQDRKGRLHLAGHGHTVDWLVRMKRLPLAQTLEHRLRIGRGQRMDARHIVERVLGLYDQGQRPRITPAQLRQRTLDDIALSECELSRPEFSVPEREISQLVSALRRFIARHGSLLDARARERRIGEGHGDLRPEHIYLTEPPTIIDCIEFDRGLRQRDPVDELAFLALECERLGHPEWRAWLLAHYSELTGDRPPMPLIAFYQAAHALKRARLAILHIEDEGTGPAWHWVTSARDYLQRGIAHMASIDESVGPDAPKISPRSRR